MNRTKIKEIGRDAVVGWRSTIPTVNVTMRQLENGALAFWNELANKATSNTVVTLTDFKTSMVDILGYKTDDSGTFLGTVMYPKLRTSGFSLNIGDPEAIAERNFTLVGEDEFFWQNSNKYVVFFSKTAPASGSNWVIEIGASGQTGYPYPVKDPDTSGSYIFRIVRVRSGVNTFLTEGTDYTYNSGNRQLIILTPTFGDLYKIWYTAATYISATEPFVVNDSDLSNIGAECFSIYLTAGQYVYRLQSVAVDVTFDRQDIKEVGNYNVVSTGVRNKTVRITLGRILETYAIEEILRNKVSASWGKLDPRQFVSNSKLYIRVYDDKDKDTFKLGYSFANLAAVNLDAGVPLDDYAKRGTQLEGEDAIITSVLGSM